MALQLQDFAREYESRTDDELLRLAMARAELTPEAGVALSAELSRRGLAGDEPLKQFEEEEQERTRDQARDTGRLFLSFNGIGRCRFLKWDYVFDPAFGYEEFTTTVFMMLFWLPLIPTGTFRVRRKKSFAAGGIEVLDRLPLNWTQISAVWAAMTTTMLALVIIFRLAVRFVR
ncbi:MAG TPA: hypothetical protein VMD25_08300 [Acidobacteriaceae bacterium]|nr:hypothetical protein [Acidobacteriaceae bacterium]